MTEEELKKIKAPGEGEPKKYTEHQKRVNSFWLQMLGALILLALGVIFVAGIYILAAWFFGRIVGADVSVMKNAGTIAILAGILLAWLVSRKICALLVMHTRIKDAVSSDLVDFYSGK